MISVPLIHQNFSNQTAQVNGFVTNGHTVSMVPCALVNMAEDCDGDKKGDAKHLHKNRHVVLSSTYLAVQQKAACLHRDGYLEETHL